MVFPPKADKRAYILTAHGDTRVDNYYWLRDDNRENKKVLEYLEEENSYSETLMSKHRVLRNHLFKELIERMPDRDFSIPYVLHGYRYQSRYERGKEYAIYTRKLENTKENKWEILLDGNQRAANSDFYTMGSLKISDDHQIMAIAEDFKSRGLYSLRYKNIVDDSWFPEVIEDTDSHIEWARNLRVIYYVRKNKKTLWPYQVWRHIIGMPTTQDELIYEEQDKTFNVNIYKTTSERYIVISLNSTISDEILLLDAGNIKAKPKVFLSRRPEHEYSIDHYQGYFYILSNREGINFALYRSKNNDEKLWHTMIPDRKNVVLENFIFLKDWLVIEERYMGIMRLRQIHLIHDEEKSITSDDPTSVMWIAYNPDPNNDFIRYGYSSMTTPTSFFEQHLNTGQRYLLKQYQVKNFDKNNYKSERLWITVRDGVNVPISIVYRKNLFQPGKNPLLVYGYGSYGSSLDPYFCTSRLSLLDRGFVYALAHIRGGGELGQKWYESGKVFNKMNTFYDFIDSIHALIEQGYSDPHQVFAMGGSAGGLLMGVVINLEPALFKGVIAKVPFVDVLTTMLDPSIPLTTSEYNEWGNPEDSEDVYYYIKKYSPYDQVRAQFYPHLLVTSGLYDSQVQYWEPAKWVAKLRDFKMDKNLLLFFTDMTSGHHGKSGRYKIYEEIALEYSFLLSLAHQN